MTNLLAPVAKAKFFDNNGRPAVGYKLYTYQAGTDTKADTFPGAGASTPNSNPITLDYRGECNIWIPPNVAYKLVFSPPNDTDPPTAPIWSVDDIVDSQLVTLYGGVDTGIANAYVIDFGSNFTAYLDGIAIFWIPSSTNTGASTINVNGLGPVPIINQDGSPLYLGQLQANQFALIIYKGTGFNLIDFGLLPKTNVQNGNYTFQLGDANNIVLADAPGTSTWTLPSNSDVPFPVGTTIDLSVVGGALKRLTISPGVTMVYFFNDRQPITLSNSAVSIRKIDVNTWQQVTISYYGFTEYAFTGTITGISGAATILMSSKIFNGFVTILATSGRTNASTSTAMTVTGLPSEVTPPTTRYCTCFGVIDNGIVIPAVASISSSGEITLQTGAVPPGGFASGGATKGIAQGFQLTYQI